MSGPRQSVVLNEVSGSGVELAYDAEAQNQIDPNVLLRHHSGPALGRRQATAKSEPGGAT